MKNHIFKFIAILSIFVFSTCNEDYLDVENKNNLTVDNWYQTAEDFEMAINSCYGALMDAGMFGQQFHLRFGIFSDRILFESTGQDRLIFNSSDDWVNNMWRGIYFGLFRTSKLIRQANEKGPDDIEGMTEDMYDYVIAQAKALRAAYYFYLTVIYHKPIFYNEENIPEDFLQNLTNGEPIQFWDQLEKDLTEAIPNLKFKSEMSESDYGRVTKGGARSLYGKAMLYKHYHYHCQNGNKGSAEDVADLEKAQEMFEAVMNSGEYALVQPMEPKTKQDYIYALLSNSSWIDLPAESGNEYKSENNIESVWEIQYDDGPAHNSNVWLPGWLCPGEMNFQYFSPHTNSYKNGDGHPALYYEFETEGAPEGFDRDPRYEATYYQEGELMHFDSEAEYYIPYEADNNSKKVADARSLPLPPGQSALMPKKHYYPVYHDPGNERTPLNSPCNKRMIRYADVLLMYAEVMHLLGNNTGAGLDALNEVRERVDMPAIDALTKESIMHERDIELAFELSRWFDLIRWSFDPEWGINWDELDWGIDSENSINPFVKGKNEYFPIPITEIDLNEGQLKQNPGW